MSNSLPEDERQVYSFLQKSLDKSREQDAALQGILNRMMQIESNVLDVEKNVEMKFTKISDMLQQVRESVTLNDVEKYELQSTVFRKSVEFAKDRYHEEDSCFSKIVGKYRRMIWKKLKERFETARYSHIRRVDYQNAMDFVSKFKPEDYL